MAFGEKIRAYLECSARYRTLMSARLFVSHASADLPVVRPFVEDLIESGLGVHTDEIFCSSLPGQRVRPGADFKSFIRQTFDEATTVIAILSPNFYSSAFCLCELGAAWILARDNFIPVLMPNASFSDMQGVEAGLQALRMNVADDLHELRDDLTRRLGIPGSRVARWNQRVEGFLSRLDQLVPLCAPESPPARAPESPPVLNSASSREEPTTLRLGMPSERAREVKDLAREIDLFRAKAEAASSAALRLQPISQEALYCYYGAPDQCLDLRAGWHKYSQDDFEKARQHKEVHVEFPPSLVKIVLEAPRVRAAVTALDRLWNWLEKGTSADFKQHFFEKYELSPTCDDRGLWERFILPKPTFFLEDPY